METTTTAESAVSRLAPEAFAERAAATPAVPEARRTGVQRYFIRKQ